MLENNVRLESVTEPLDTSPLSNFLRQALAFAAAIEREKIIERNVRGTQNKVDQGQMIGVGKAKYGFAWGDEKHTFYTINPVTGTIVHRIFHLYIIEHMSVRRIAGKLHTEEIPTPSGQGHWGTTTVRRILTDKFYMGEGTNRRIKWEWIDGKRKSHPHPNPTALPEGTVPPIVTKDMWYAAQEKLAVAKQEAPRHNKEPEQTLLRTGYIRCGYCGRAMTVVRYLTKMQGEKHPTTHYRCGAANTPALHTCSCLD
jgi:site-specific DNA recombinase